MLRLDLLKIQYHQALPIWRGVMLSAASLLVLSACGGNGGTITTSGPNSDPAPASVADSSEAIAPLDPAKVAVANQATTAAANNKTTGAVAPVEKLAPIPTPMETFRALAPQQGLNITPLFKDPVSDDSARIKRLEDAVQNMHNDFETIMPTMVRMASMEKDMRGLIDKLHTLTGTPQDQGPLAENQDDAEGAPMALTQDPTGTQDTNDGNETDWDTLDDIDTQTLAASTAAATHGPVTVTKTETTTVTTKAPETAAATPKIDGAAEIKAIRIADHTDSTRIVLDMSAKAAIPPASFQNDNKQLVLDLPQINWNAKTESMLKNSGLVSSYQYENGKLTLTLTRAAEIKGQQSLPPEGSSGYRFVLDLKAKA